MCFVSDVVGIEWILYQDEHASRWNDNFRSFARFIQMTTRMPNKDLGAVGLRAGEHGLSVRWHEHERKLTFGG